MLRQTIAAALVIIAMPASSETEKEISCGYQSDVVTAIQQARLDKVKERSVEKAVLDTNPEWPAKFNKTIPLIAPWVYELPIKQVRENDLGDVWNESCMNK